MTSDIDSPDPFEDNYEYSHGGRNFGNPLINAAMHGLFGRNLMPEPRNGQDMYDSLIQRERSQHFMNLQSSGFSNNMLNQSLGLSGPAATMVGRFAGSPDGGLARMLSPMVGGNPMAASMQTYASLSGASTMGAFGRLHSASESESQEVMNSLADNFYKTQRYEGRGGIAEELQQDSNKFLKGLIDKNDKASVKHLEDSGLSFQKNSQGLIADPEGLKRDVDKMDVTSGFEEGKAEEIRKAQVTAGLGRDMSRLVNETDEEVKKALEERMQKIFKATGVAIKDMVGGQPSSPEKQAARKELAADVFKALDAAAAAPDVEKGKHTEDIKRQFRDMGASEGMLQKLTKDDGSIDRVAATKLAQDFADGRTDLADVESVEATRARNAKYDKAVNKKLMLRNFEIATGEYEADDSDKSREGKEKYEKGKEQHDGFKSDAFNKLKADVQKNLGITEAEFDEKYMTADKVGGTGPFNTGGERKLLEAKLRDDIEKSTQLSSTEQAVTQKDQFGAAGFRRKGINFENTRGFKLEDFTSGFAKATELRMLGDTRGQSPAEAMGNFSKNAGGVMAAARSIFGNRSGGELIQKTSDLMGLTSVNLSTPKGAEEAEDMLRKVKSTARVAGLSVKHMLGMIEATRELARSNPQLQHMNQGSLTNLAMHSAMNATSAGSQMNSTDFRNAGGQQGIQADETRSSLAFSQSGMGRLMTVALGQAKANGRYKEMLELVKSGKFTERNLANGGYAEIAKVAGMTTGGLSYLANDPAAAQRYSKDKDVSDPVTTFGADASTMGTINHTVARGIFKKSGMEKELQALYAKSKKEGMSDEDFESKYIDPNLTHEQRATFQTHKVKFFRGMREAAMPTAVKEALTKIRDADVQASKETSKKFEGRTGSLASQAITAVMSGGGMDNIAEALVGMFATKGDTSESKSRSEKAQKSAKGLYDSLKEKGMSERERLQTIDEKSGEDKKSNLERLNDVIDVQRQQALETGDTERASALGNVTKKDLLSLQAVTAGSAEEAAGRLKYLQGQGAKRALTDNEQAELAGYATASKLTGGFKDEAAYQAVKKGNLKDILGGVLKGGQASAEAEQKKITDKSLYKTLDTQLNDLAKSTDPAMAEDKKDVQVVQDYYASRGGAEQMAKDLNKGEGFFKDKDVQDKYRKNVVGSAVAVTEDLIAKKDEIAKGSGSKAPAEDAAHAAFSKAIQPILDALTGQNSLKEAIKALATALGAKG